MSKGKSSVPGDRQKFFFQFVTTPTSDTPGTSLLLHFDTKRYFFGRIAEGTQRACIQRGIGIKKVRNVFLTGPTSWSSMGGLIGMILTMADVQSEEVDPVTGKRPMLRIQGGPKLTHSIACARRFVFRTGMPLEIYEADPRRDRLEQPSYVDENISVWSIPVSSARGRASSPRLPNGRSQSPNTLDREQKLRAETVKNMFDSDWRKDRLVESRFDEVKLPALVWIRDPETKELSSTQCTTMADAPHLQPHSRVLVRNPWPASLVEELPPIDNIAGSFAMSYIVKGKPQRGKFIPQKAKELGVKPGPNYAVLTAGGSVTLDDGTVITSGMVLGATEPAKGMAIFDVPSVEYLDGLSEKIDELRGEIINGIETVSWLLGKGVLPDTTFSQLVNSLPGIQHIVSSSDATSDYLALDSAAASSVRLAQIRPECFKVPVHDNGLGAMPSFQENTSIIPAERGMIVQVAPKASLNKNEIPPLLDVEATKASYHEILKDLVPAPTDTDNQHGQHDDVQITTLGTGSAVPSKYRNVSATLIRVPGSGSHLFDCGENTLGMLQRTFKASELEEVLVDLRMIWISHLHADHHLGTLSLIEAKREVMQRRNLSEPKLYVISEPNMADYLNDYNSVQSSAHCELLSVLNSVIRPKNRGSSASPIDISETSLPIKEFLTTKVSHCHGAQACSVTFSNGFKFSYSGDCRPSAQFARIGQNSDVLLHEATFDDGLEGDAVAKKHSTTAEALAVADAMKAKNVVLTHFSQRYQKIPVLNKVKFGGIKFEESNDAEEAGPIEETDSTSVLKDTSDAATGTAHSTTDGNRDSDAVANLQRLARERNICVAFDLMSIKVKHIRDMHKYYPAIEKMFELEHEKSEAKREERREANEQMKENKDIREGKWKGEAAGKTKKPAAATQSGNIYERINRTKVKGSKDANDSEAQPSTSTSSSNNTGVVENGHAQPQMSNRAMKKAIRKDQAAQKKQEARTASPGVKHESGGTVDSDKVTRRLSNEAETSEAKRVKLDDNA